MPEPRRRSARRNLMAGLIRYDRIQTTESRARAIRSEVEKLIDKAVKGRKAAREYLAGVVSDEEKATQILEFARRGRFSLKKTVASNEERAEQLKVQLYKRLTRQWSLSCALVALFSAHCLTNWLSKRCLRNWRLAMSIAPVVIHVSPNWVVAKGMLLRWRKSPWSSAWLALHG